MSKQPYRGCKEAAVARVTPMVGVKEVGEAVKAVETEAMEEAVAVMTAAVAVAVAGLGESPLLICNHQGCP